MLGQSSLLIPRHLIAIIFALLVYGNAVPPSGLNGHSMVQCSSVRPLSGKRAPMASSVATSGDFKSFFAKWKESTSTSPEADCTSGPPLPTSSPAAPLQQPAEAPWNDDSRSSWHFVMIKNKNPPAITRTSTNSSNKELLRAMHHRFEADYNWLIEMLFGRRMVPHAHAVGVLNLHYLHRGLGTPSK